MIQADEIDGLLVRLVDKSLTIYDDRVLRYRLLATVRQYATEALEDTVVRKRHFHHYRALCENIDEKVRGPQQVEWLERFDDEQDNFRAALAWSLEERSFLSDAAEMAWNLLDYWMVRATFAEAADWFSALLDRIPQEETEARVLCLVGLACCCRYRDDPRDINLLREALDLSETHGIERGIRLALYGIGFSYSYRGEHKRAREYYSRCLPLQTAAGAKVAEAYTNIDISLACLHEGDLDKAELYLQRGLQLRSELGDVRGVGAAKIQAARIAERRNDLRRAAMLCIEGMSTLALTGDMQNLAGCCGMGACPLWMARRFDEAASVLGFGDAIQAQIETKREAICEEFHQGWMDRLRKEMGSSEFEAAYARGKRLDMVKVLHLIHEARF